MDNILISTVLIACSIGLTAGIILFWIAKSFYVEEDPLIDKVNEALPAANCGGCGFPGCRNFAEACVTSETLEGLFCPVGGNEVMQEVAKILGQEIKTKAATIAVSCCNGSLQNRPKQSTYDGPSSCAVAAALYRGETGCQYGCLGFGDCVVACQFDAIVMDEETGLPVVDEDKCVACEACVKACPRLILEMRVKGPKNRRIFVQCVNKDKGNVAMKNCKAACIGCGKCFQVCPFGAIEMRGALAYIDDEKCKLCRKCVAVCPTHAIHEINFPPRPAKVAEKKVEE